MRKDFDNHWIIIITVVSLTAIIHLTSFRYGHNWGGDFAGYIHQAQAIANGSFDHLAQLVRFRIDNSTPTIMVGPEYYPWGFPTLLAPIIAIFGASLTTMKIYVLGFLLASQIAMFYLLKDKLHTAWIVSITLMLGLNPWVFSFKDSIISDVPATFFVLLALITINTSIVKKKHSEISARTQILVGLSILAAYFVRAQGLALLPTLLAAQLISAWPKNAKINFRGLCISISNLGIVSLVPYVTFVTGMSLLAFAFSDGASSYTSSGHFAYRDIGEFLDTLVSNTWYYAKLPNDLLGHHPMIYVLLIVPSVLLGVLSYSKRDYLLVLFVIFHMVILLVFPYRQGLRFVFPIIPIYLYFFAAGAYTILRMLSKRFDSAQIVTISSISAMLLIVSYNFYFVAKQWQEVSTLNANDIIQDGPYMKSAVDVFDYIREETDTNASVIFFKPRVLMLLADRRGILQVNPDDILDSHADYLLIYNGKSNVINEQLRENVEIISPRLLPVYSNSKFDLYSIVGINSN